MSMIVTPGHIEKIMVPQFCPESFPSHYCTIENASGQRIVVQLRCPEVGVLVQAIAKEKFMGGIPENHAAYASQCLKSASEILTEVFDVSKNRYDKFMNAKKFPELPFPQFPEVIIR